jgi:hypothetical protein
MFPHIAAPCKGAIFRNPPGAHFSASGANQGEEFKIAQILTTFMFAFRHLPHHLLDMFGGVDASREFTKY